MPGRERQFGLLDAVRVGRGFWREEGAQATTEYILMLAVLVTLALVVLKKGLQPLFERLQRTLTQRLEKGMFPPGEGMRRNPLIHGR